MARENLALVPEKSFGVPVDTPVNGTTRHYVRLEDGGSFQGLMVPDLITTARGNGVVGPSCFNSDSKTLTGGVQTKFYDTQTDLLLGWATTPIDSGRTKPWVTTDVAGVMPVGSLATLSAYHSILEVATWKRRRPSALVCQSLTLSASRQDPVWKANATFVGVRDDTNATGTVADPLIAEIPMAVDSDYPCSPWLFSHLSGGLKIGATRTMFDSVSFTWTNSVKPLYWESTYPITIPYFGRTITVDVSLYRKPSPDEAASFRSLTPQQVTATLNDGFNSLLLDFGSNCYWTKLDQVKPVDDAYTWSGTLTVGADPATGNDFSYTYTPGT